MIPKVAKKMFKVEWQPILRKMEQATGLRLPPYPPEIKSAVIETTFAIGTEHLKRTVCSFLWDKNYSMIENCSVASWYSFTQRSYNLKNGNPSNISNLPSETRYIAKYETKLKVKRNCNYGNVIFGNDNTFTEVRITVI